MKRTILYRIILAISLIALSGQSLGQGVISVFKDASNTGTGTVISNPAGINCDASCLSDDARYNDGTVVTLIATASSDSVFTGWGSLITPCSGANTCQFLIKQGSIEVVLPKFDLAPIIKYTLVISKSGAGSGTVTSNPSGIDCGSDCSESYIKGTLVTLSASALSGSTFTGWSGACSGTSSCQVTMDSTKSVTATFNNSNIMPWLMYLLNKSNASN